MARPVQLGGVPCDRFRRSGRWWWRAGGRCRSVARDRTVARDESAFDRMAERIELAFGTEASFDLSYTVLQVKNRVSPQ